MGTSDQRYDLFVRTPEETSCKLYCVRDFSRDLGGLGLRQQIYLKGDKGDHLSPFVALLSKDSFKRPQNLQGANFVHIFHSGKAELLVERVD